MNKKLADQIRALFEENLHLKEIFKKGASSFAIRIFGILSSSIFAFFVAKYLGAASLGIYSICMAILTFASILGLVGLDTASIRFNAEYASQAKYQNIYNLGKFSLRIISVTSFLISIMLFLFADHIADFFQIENLGTSIRWISFAVLPFSMTLFNARALRGLKEISKSIFLENAAFPTFNLIVITALFFLLKDSADLVVISLVITIYIVTMLSFRWFIGIVKKYNTDQRAEINNKEIFRVSFPLMLASSIMFIKGWIDILMLGYFLTEADVGVYNIALKLAMLASLPLMAVNSIAAPKFAEMNKQKGELQNIVQITTFIIFLCSLPILIILISIPETILGFIGEEYLQATTVLILLATGQFFNSISGSAGYLLQMTGKQFAYQNITLFITVLGVILNLLLIPQYGITGAAISTFSTTILLKLIFVIFAKMKLNLITFLNPFYLIKLFKNDR